MNRVVGGSDIKAFIIISSYRYAFSWKSLATVISRFSAFLRCFIRPRIKAYCRSFRIRTNDLIAYGSEDEAAVIPYKLKANKNIIKRAAIWDKIPNWRNKNPKTQNKYLIAGVPFCVHITNVCNQTFYSIYFFAYTVYVSR